MKGQAFILFFSFPSYALTAGTHATISPTLAGLVDSCFFAQQRKYITPLLNKPIANYL